MLTKVLLQRAKDAGETTDLAYLQSSQQAFEDEVLMAVQNISFGSVKIFLDFVRGGDIPEIPPLGSGRIARRDELDYYSKQCVIALCVLSKRLKSSKTLEEGKECVESFVSDLTDPLRAIYPRATVYLLQYHRSEKINPELFKEPKFRKDKRGGKRTPKKTGD